VNARAGSPARTAFAKTLTGVDATYVGYRNNQLATPDLIAGTLSFMVIDAPSGKFILNSSWPTPSP
jgi:hypothetical protein